MDPDDIISMFREFGNIIDDFKQIMKDLSFIWDEIRNLTKAKESQPLSQNLFNILFDSVGFGCFAKKKMVGFLMERGPPYD